MAGTGAASATPEGAAQPGAAQPGAATTATAEPQGAAQGPAAPAAAEAEAPAPESDPRFKGVIKRLERTARKEKAHEPAPRKVTAARAAVKPPANDRSSRAQANQVEVMDQVMDKQEPPAIKQKKDDFLSLLRAEMARIAPRNLDDARNFKKQGKAGQLKATLTGQVQQQKASSTRDIRAATETTPDPDSVEAKQVTPLPAEAAEKPPGNLRSKDVLPLPKAEAEISVEANQQQAEQLMAENDIDEEQLERANEPQFSEALEAKHELAEHADQVPATYRGEEQAYLKSARGAVVAEEQAAKREMRGSRAGSKTDVRSRQETAREKEERERKQVADKIQGMYNATRQKVEGKLNALDGEVNDLFDRGEKAAREQFETYVDREVSAYKRRRYSGVRGKARWVRDLFADLPDEVNRYYEQGREQYIKDMDAVLVRIANRVETRLQEARNAISAGKKEIRTYVESLRGNLQTYGQEAQDDISARFDELQESVDSKKRDLARNLAQRYQASRDKLDQRIKELQAQNKGLLSKFVDKIKEIIKILREFKERIMGLLRQAGNVIRKIIKDPIGFLKKLLSAVKQGFNQFRESILTHLKKGLLGWLFGALASAGIEIPSEFSFKAILGLVLQIIGVTKERLRAKVAKLIGARNIERIEKAWSVVSTLVSEGPAGLWKQIQEYVGDLKETIISEAREWVITQIIKQGVLWVISLFNPVSALIRAIQAIYNVVMFFVERINQIMQLVEAVIQSVTRIVAGDIAAAANWIEQAMGRAVPLIISFLARLLGLGGISEKITSIIKKLQHRVDKAIDKALLKIVGKIKGVIGKVKGGAGRAVAKGKQVLGKLLEWWRLKTQFKAADNQTHKVYYEGKSASSELLVATSPIKVENFLKAKRNEAASIKDAGAKQQQLVTIGQAETLNAEIKKKQKDLVKANAESKTAKQSKPLDANQNLYKDLNRLIKKLGNTLKSLFTPDQSDFPPILLPPFSDNVTATGLKAQFVRKTGLPKGTAANAHKGRLGGWDKLVAAKLTSNSAWVKMHLLTEQLGGQATDSNLTPARGPETNTKFYNQMERYAIDAIQDRKTMIWYQVTVSYHSPPNQDYISSISASWGPYTRKNNNWQEGPASKHAFSQSPAPPDFSGATEAVDFNQDGRTRIQSIVGSESFAKIIIAERENGKFLHYGDLKLRLLRREKTLEGRPIEDLDSKIALVKQAVREGKAKFSK